MEVGIPCSRCRERFLVKARSKSVGIVCHSCREHSVLPVPTEEQTCQQPQRLRSRIKILGSQMKNRIMHKGTSPPSLNHEPASGSNPIRSSKRAVLCGITYNNWKKYKLKGPINDVRNMRNLLIKNFGYPEECIVVLTEEETDQRFIPTRKNIENSLRWLVNDDCRSGDSLVFFYSGHGLRQPDFDNDEDDGFDETICPVDFREVGMITDNDLNSLIVRPLKQGVTLHAIVDACHSGTILDLPYIYYSQEKRWQDNRPPSGVSKRTNGGLAISISACLDGEAAADTTAFTGKMNGALTYLLAEVLKILPGRTYGDLFDLIHESFDKANQRCLANSRILSKVLNSRFSQTPLLSSSDQFDVYKKTFVLVIKQRHAMEASQ